MTGLPLKREVKDGLSEMVTLRPELNEERREPCRYLEGQHSKQRQHVQRHLTRVQSGEEAGGDALPLSGFPANRPPPRHLLLPSTKRLLTTQETWARSLGREDAMEKEMATHSSALA